MKDLAASICRRSAIQRFGFASGRLLFDQNEPVTSYGRFPMAIEF